VNTRSLVQRAIPFAWLLLSSTPAVAQQVVNGTTVTVPSLSQPSPWNTGALTVGSTGTGTLNVGAGGAVNSTTSTLGSTATGTGTVNVSGAGAVWTAANGGSATLTVGSLGAGSLNIGNGGRVQTIGNASANVGSATTGTGTVTVTGAGSALSVANALFINAGTMQVANGGSLSATTATLNGGSLALTGSDSRLSLVNNIFIRNAASVILADGARATSFRVWIGEQVSAATSRLTVRNGARWIMDPALNPPTYSVLTVGRRANGELLIESGGVVSGVRTTIGGEEASNVPNVSGVVTVAGSGSLLATKEFMNVGELGTGTLSILQGGTVTSGSATVGTLPTGHGSITVDGAGSSLIVGQAASGLSRTFVVGNNGNVNNLTVSGGGLVEAHDSFTVGRQLGAHGNIVTVTGAGSKLWVDGGFAVGRNGANNMTVVRDGARLETMDQAWIGGAAGSPAIGNHVDITGAGTMWLLGGDLHIGSATSPLKDGVEDTPPPVVTATAANNYLLVSGGGAVTQTGGSTTIGGGNRLTVEGASSFTSDGGIALGTAGDASAADLQVSGASAVTAKGALAAGAASSGNRVTLDSGARLATGSALLGGATGADGNSVTLSGGALWSVGDVPGGSNGALVLGDAGSANLLDIGNGSRVEAHGGFVSGNAAGASQNRVTVSGSGAALFAEGGFTVGRAGAGNSVSVGNGASLTTSGPAAIGAGASATGNFVEISGAGSTWSLAGDLGLGGGGGNLLAISGGGAVTQTGGGTTIGAGGNQLLVDDNSTFTSDGAISVGDGSRLSLGADARVTGGSLAMAAGSQLDVFAQEGNSSLLSFSGKAELGGTLSALIDGRSSLSYRFLVLEAGEVDGTFDRTVLNDYSANLGWTVQYTPEQVWLQLNAIIGDVDGLNENQRNVADSLDDYFNRGGQLPPSFVPILGLTGSELGQALSQLSGEVGASGGAAAAASANTSFLRSMLNHAAPACEARREDDPLRRCEHAVWAAAFGSTAELPGNSAKGSHDTTITTSGLVTGWDYAKDDMRVGVAIAGGGTGWNLDGSGMGNGDATFLQLGAYGTKQMGQAYAALAGAYALQAMSTERRVTALQDESLDADLIANAVAGRGEAGYRFGAAAGLGVTPYAALQGQAIRLPGYDESGTLDDGSYALSFNATTTTAVRSELGLGLDMDTAAAAFSARAAWAHDWLNDAYARAGFQSLPGTSFIVNGAEAPADIALVSLSAEADLSEQTAVTARFDGEFGADYQSYAGTLALTYSW